MNYFVLGAAALYFFATVQAISQTKWPLVIIYMCYGLANAALVYIDYHIK